MEEQFVVRLDVLELPKGPDYHHAITIAESLMYICKIYLVWDEPEHGHRLYYVRKMPEDIPQAGIRWIKVENLPTRPSYELFVNQQGME